MITKIRAIQKIIIFISINILIIFSSLGSYNALNNNIHLNDLSASWKDPNPPITPPIISRTQLVYDSSNDKIILFGGEDSDSMLQNITWAYDYNSNVWAERSPTSAPSARHRFPMVYDSFNDKAILFGGRSAIGRQNDTWTYDYGSNTWDERSPTTAPSARDSMRVVYDSVRKKVILFGGYDGTYQNDTWEYDYFTNNWTDLKPTYAPSPRKGYQMLYDSNNDKVILFGGKNQTNDFFDLWQFDYNSNTWSEVITSSPSLSNTPLIYDSALSKYILFGGKNQTGKFMTNLWIYDYPTNNWNSIKTNIPPSGRISHHMTFDSNNNKTILYGGADVNNNPLALSDFM